MGHVFTSFAETWAVGSSKSHGAQAKDSDTSARSDATILGGTANIWSVVCWYLGFCIYKKDEPKWWYIYRCVYIYILCILFDIILYNIIKYHLRSIIYIWYDYMCVWYDIKSFWAKAESWWERTSNQDFHPKGDPLAVHLPYPVIVDSSLWKMTANTSI